MVYYAYDSILCDSLSSLDFLYPNNIGNFMIFEKFNTFIGFFKSIKSIDIKISFCSFPFNDEWLVFKNSHGLISL